MYPNIKIDLTNFNFSIEGKYDNGNQYCSCIIPKDDLPEHRKSSIGKLICKAISIVGNARKDRSIVKIKLLNRT